VKENEKADDTPTVEDPKPKARRVVLNPEMAAVADIEEILGKLPPKSQRRVLCWVNETYIEGQCEKRDAAA